VDRRKAVRDPKTKGRDASCFFFAPWAALDRIFLSMFRQQGLTYFVELPAPQLRALFERPGLLPLLQETGASIAMAMLDLSPERREVCAVLNALGIPVTAWLVLDTEAGYWLTADNAHLGHARYRELLAWARATHLRLEAIGLDLETPHDDVREILEQGRAALRRLFLQRRSREALERAAAQYRALCEEIRHDGFRVETYQFPLVLDERRAGSTLLQRTFGFVDVAPDREVLMLYESLLPAQISEAMVDTYGADCQAIGVGLTGGGVDLVLEAIGQRTLSLERLLTALRRARRYTPHLYVFSLEGCVEAGYLEALCAADLTRKVIPTPLALGGALMRAGLRLALRGGRLLERLDGHRRR